MHTCISQKIVQGHLFGLFLWRFEITYTICRSRVDYIYIAGGHLEKVVPRMRLRVSQPYQPIDMNEKQGKELSAQDDCPGALQPRKMMVETEEKGALLTHDCLL
jgi:hypothetical protein